MKAFTAAMHYNKDTNYRLARIISRVRTPWRLPVLYLICILSISSGFFYFTGILSQLAVIAFGCFLFTSIQVPAKGRAKQSMDAVGAEAFTVAYSFQQDCLTLTSTIGQENQLDYSQIIRLAEDRKYLYVFSDLSSAYMIEKASVDKDGCRELKTFLSLKSNQAWKYIF